MGFNIPAPAQPQQAGATDIFAALTQQQAPVAQQNSPFAALAQPPAGGQEEGGMAAFFANPAVQQALLAFGGNLLQSGNLGTAVLAGGNAATRQQMLKQQKLAAQQEANRAERKLRIEEALAGNTINTDTKRESRLSKELNSTIGRNDTLNAKTQHDMNLDAKEDSRKDAMLPIEIADLINKSHLTAEQVLKMREEALDRKGGIKLDYWDAATKSLVEEGNMEFGFEDILTRYNKMSPRKSYETVSISRLSKLADMFLEDLDNMEGLDGETGVAEMAAQEERLENLYGPERAEAWSKLVIEKRKRKQKQLEADKLKPGLFENLFGNDGSTVGKGSFDNLLRNVN